MASGTPERQTERHSEGTAGYSNPPSGKEFSPRGREMPFGPRRRKKNDAGQTGDFGESHDHGLGGSRGAGGKIDSSQRDMGQTGQNMKGVG